MNSAPNSEALLTALPWLRHFPEYLSKVIVIPRYSREVIHIHLPLSGVYLQFTFYHGIELVSGELVTPNRVISLPILRLRPKDYTLLFTNCALQDLLKGNSCKEVLKSMKARTRKARIRA